MSGIISMRTTTSSMTTRMRRTRPLTIFGARGVRSHEPVEMFKLIYFCLAFPGVEVFRQTGQPLWKQLVFAFALAYFARREELMYESDNEQAEKIRGGSVVLPRRRA
jgi:hypothetical protein